MPKDQRSCSKFLFAQTLLVSGEPTWQWHPLPWLLKPGWAEYVLFFLWQKWTHGPWQRFGNLIKIDWLNLDSMSDTQMGKKPREVKIREMFQKSLKLRFSCTLCSAQARIRSSKLSREITWSASAKLLRNQNTNPGDYEE